jgi:hypothetical protein
MPPVPIPVLFALKSDHFPVFINLHGVTKDRNVSKRGKRIKVFTNMNNAINSMCDDLYQNDIYAKLNKGPFSSPNDNYDVFHDQIVSTKDKYISHKFVKFDKYKHKDNPWITHGIIKSIKFRDILYRKLLSTPSDAPNYNALNMNLKTYRSLLKRIIRESKRVYFSSIFQKYKHNLKQTWYTINSILCKSKKNTTKLSEILIDGKKYTNDLEIATQFNNYFVGIGPTLSNRINVSDNVSHHRYLTRRILCSFKFDLVTEDNVLKIINSLQLKNSYGHDGISVRILKGIAPSILKAITLIINQSLITGIFPDKLKIARVIPLFKKGTATDMNNYRPISLLTATSKVFEKVAFTQLYSYFQMNNLFHGSQYGFRPLHSTELAALDLVDRVSFDLENKNNSIAIYMDLSKAFDTLDHDILLSKLHYYGIEGSSLDWFKSYLSNRKQYVDINDATSSHATISTGVPQGSILGPLLFIIYINDIPASSNYFKPILYADDTTLLSTFDIKDITQENINNFALKINSELANVYAWLCTNKLSLNKKKN